MDTGEVFFFLWIIFAIGAGIVQFRAERAERKSKEAIRNMWTPGGENKKPRLQLRQFPPPARIQFYRENIYGRWEANGKKRLDLDETGLRADGKLFIPFDQIRKMAVMRLPMSGQRLLRIDYDSAEGEPQTVGLALSEFGLRDWGLSLQGHTGLWVENLEGRKKKDANGEEAS